MAIRIRQVATGDRPAVARTSHSSMFGWLSTPSQSLMAFSRSSDSPGPGCTLTNLLRWNWKVSTSVLVCTAPGSARPS